MDLIQILKERVIPIVLNQEELEQNSTLVSEKKTAISIFLPILLFILRAKPEFISTLQNNLNPRLSDLFPHDLIAQENLIDSIQQSIPKGETENLLNRSIAPTLAVLEDLAGTRDDRGILHYLEQNRELIRGSLPVWSVPILTGFGLSDDVAKPYADTSLSTPPSSAIVEPIQTPQQTLKQQPKKKSRAWLPLIFIIILVLLAGLFLRYCQQEQERKKAEQAKMSSSLMQETASFQLTTDSQGDLVSCQMLIGNPNFVAATQKEIRTVFNHQQGCTADSSENYSSELTDQNALSGVISLLRQTPDIQFTWTGAEISIQGNDFETVKKISKQVKSLVPNVNVMFQQPVVNIDEAILSSISAAEQALANLHHDQVRPIDIAEALNLQIINFTSGSDEIPEINKPVLDKAAELMNGVENVHLTINGYTDSTGNAVDNKALSLKRAQSVMKYLITKGVSENKLSAKGYGQDQPIADNSTFEGQFKNRRIEFSVVNTETGTERTVTDKGVEKKS